MDTDQDKTDRQVTRGGVSGLPGTRTGWVSPPHAAFLRAMPSTLKQSPNTGSIPQHPLHPACAMPRLARAGHLPGFELFCLLFASKELERGNYTLARSQPSPSLPANPRGCSALRGCWYFRVGVRCWWRIKGVDGVV